MPWASAHPKPEAGKAPHHAVAISIMAASAANLCRQLGDRLCLAKERCPLIHNLVGQFQLQTLSSWPHALSAKW